MFGAVRSCVAFEEEFVRTIEMGQVDLAEEKSGRIVVDEGTCLRAVRGNGASLLFLGLAIDADPEAATPSDQPRSRAEAYVPRQRTRTA